MRCTPHPSFTACQAIFALFLVLFTTSRCEAEDIIFSAIDAELKRTTSALKLSDLPSPYFVSYSMREAQRFEVAASLGALTKRMRWCGRNLEPKLRVGDYHLDNSNFASSGLEQTHFPSEAPIDNDYRALRRRAWLETDGLYKEAVQAYQEKQAFLKANNIKDRLDDFSRVKPVLRISEIRDLKVDEDYWTDTIRELSKIFREYPSIQWSFVMFEAHTFDWWFVTSEGTRVCNTTPGCYLTIEACTQAKDGEYVWDTQVLHGLDPTDLPSKEKLEAQARELADRVSQLAKAPRLTDYVGPVLFEGQAAAYFFGQTLVSNLSATREVERPDQPIAHEEAAFMDRIGRRVLPSFITIRDDPLACEHQGVRLIGGFDPDDEGVQAQKLTLVDKGILKTLCTNRTPTRASNASNGHCVGDVAGSSILFVDSDKRLPRKALYQTLRKLGRAQDLDYVLVIRRRTHFPASGSVIDSEPELSSYSTQSIVKLESPNVVYRVWVKTGKEELVRGLDFSPITIRSLRDIQVTGDQFNAYPWKEGTDNCAHIVCPSFITREMEFQRVTQTRKTTPLLASPLIDYQTTHH